MVGLGFEPGTARLEARPKPLSKDYWTSLPLLTLNSCLVE